LPEIVQRSDYISKLVKMTKEMATTHSLK